MRPLCVMDALQLKSVFAKRARSALAGSLAVASWREELGSRGVAREAEKARAGALRRVPAEAAASAGRGEGEASRSMVGSMVVGALIKDGLFIAISALANSISWSA